MTPVDVGRVFVDGTAGVMLSAVIVALGSVLLGARRLKGWLTK